MAEYRKKSNVIEAIQFMNNVEEVEKFVGRKLKYQDYGKSKIAIPILNGEEIALNGDYIVKGTKNEFYPCKQDVFEELYEKVK